MVQGITGGGGAGLPVGFLSIYEVTTLTDLNNALATYAGKRIVRPVGNIAVTTPVLVPSNTYLDLRLATLTAAANIDALIQSTNYPTSRSDNVFIEGGTLDGVKTSYTTIGIEGIFQNSRFQHIMIERMKNQGMLMKSGNGTTLHSIRNHIHDVTIGPTGASDGCDGGGILFEEDGSNNGENDSWITDCLMARNQVYCMKIEGSSTDLRISHNHLVPQGEAGGQDDQGIIFSYAGGTIRRIQIVDNHFENSQAEAIYAVTSGASDYGLNNIIANNTFRDCAKRVNNAKDVILLDSSAGGSNAWGIIQGNTMLSDQANKARYGINLVFTNDSYNGGLNSIKTDVYASGAINNGGANHNSVTTTS